jgi:UDP-glucose 4-epimerase
VRDYIHVADLATAHVAALRHLMTGGMGLTLNCGYGCGHSVLGVLEAVERAAGCSVPRRIAPRRLGDPPAVVAVADGMRKVLGWEPKHDSLDRIVADTLAWECRKDTAPKPALAPVPNAAQLDR